jgi:hypothetical protein
MSWRGSLAAVALAAILAVPAAAAEKGGSGEGIKVHGDWTIEIRNPDGSLDSRHEIKNALAGGQQLLAGLLGNVYTDLGWGVWLWGVAGGNCNPCAVSVTPNVPVDAQGRPVGTLELSGSETVPGPGDTQLFTVETLWSGKRRTTGAQESGSFSGRGVGIGVRAGQIVQIKVVFSFS